MGGVEWKKKYEEKNRLGKEREKRRNGFLKGW